MPFSAMDILLGFVLPALFAGGTSAVLSRFPKEGFAGRFGPSVVLVGGFLLGYFSLQLGPAIPESHWHWMPYVLLMALVIGPVSQAPGVTWFERALLFALVAIVAGQWLVPTWEDLEPSRGTYLIFWTLSIVVLALVLEPLNGTFSGAMLALALFLTAAFGAGVLALSGSLRFAQVAGAGAGALAGLAVGCRFGGSGKGLPGSSIGFVLLVGGMMLVGKVNSFSSVPLASYLLIPVAPITLWLLACGPLTKIHGAKRTLVGIGLPLVVSSLAILLAAIAE